MLSFTVRRLARRGGALALLRPLSASAQALASAAEPEPVPLSKLKDQFLNATSSTYLEELEERYRSNPKSVDKSWASFFHSMGERQRLGGRAGLGFAPAGGGSAAAAVGGGALGGRLQGALR
jgi:hypothetical protein